MDYKTVEIGESIYYEKFVRRVSNRAGANYNETKNIVNAVFEELKSLLLYYTIIHISHFGKFFVKKISGSLAHLTLENKGNKLYVEEHYIPKIYFNRIFSQRIRNAKKDLEKSCFLG